MSRTIFRSAGFTKTAENAMMDRFNDLRLETEDKRYSESGIPVKGVDTMKHTLKAVDAITILTLQDNYIDLLAEGDGSVVQRYVPMGDGRIKSSLIAEHGFSALVTVASGDSKHTLLFDFGFSEHGAAYNADALEADLTEVEALVLSHGHCDHIGGFEALVGKIGRKDIPLYVHPVAFRNPRYFLLEDGQKIVYPAFSKERVTGAGIRPVEGNGPAALFDEAVLFLGQIPRQTTFEKSPAGAFYQEEGRELADIQEDDTALAVLVEGKGLVILTGCAHSGIVNTVEYAKEITGESRVHAVIGGFHLIGADYESLLKPTIEALKRIDPDYILPSHCTGRDSIAAIEREMPDRFRLNMPGTRLVFSAGQSE